MSHILYMDTTSSVLMLALGKIGEPDFIWQKRDVSTSHRYHSAVLIPLLQQAITEAGLAVSDISALAVNRGPGSFTGLRTGITTARTLAQFLNATVYAFNSFEILAYAQPSDGWIALDALRERAYAAKLTYTENGPSYIEEPKLLPIKEADISNVTSLEAQDVFTPAVMQALIARTPDAFLLPWRELLPLYLQEPNITVRKAPAV